MTFTVEELDLIYSALNRYAKESLAMFEETKLASYQRRADRIDALCERIEEAQGAKR